MVSVILVGCGNKEKKEAHAVETDKQETILKPGSVWKEEVGGLIRKLKIIDDTTWEYSESVWKPEPVQITVQRQKDDHGIEVYKIIDSADIMEFMNKPDNLFLVVPYQKDGLTVINFIGTEKDTKDESKQEMMDEFSKPSGYKLQKTSE